MKVDRPAGLVTVSFPPEVTDAASASKEIVAAVEKLVNGKFKVQDVEWRGEIRRRHAKLQCKFAYRRVVVKCTAGKKIRVGEDTLEIYLRCRYK